MYHNLITIRQNIFLFICLSAPRPPYLQVVLAVGLVSSLRASGIWLQYRANILKLCARYDRPGAWNPASRFLVPVTCSSAVTVIECSGVGPGSWCERSPDRRAILGTQSHQHSKNILRKFGEIIRLFAIPRVSRDAGDRSVDVWKVVSHGQNPLLRTAEEIGA